MRWYYEVGSQKKGPVTQAEVETLVQDGTITASTPVWNDQSGMWIPYGELKEGAAAKRPLPRQDSSPAAQAICPECGLTFSVDEMVQYGQQWICAACKPVFFQKVKEGTSLPTSLVYASFWTRFGAKFIDTLILYVINLLVSFAAGTAMVPDAKNPAAALAPMFGVFALQLVIQAAYATFFVGKFQATPGKMALGIMVITPEGGPVSYGRALGRHFAEMLSGIILGIGYLMAAFDQEKRALHDRICGTRVVKKQN